MWIYRIPQDRYFVPLLATEERGADHFHDCHGTSGAPAIGLITVLTTILTGRQSVKNLYCSYGDPMSNNFR